MAVNMNDYLGDIYIYYAGWYKNVFTFNVEFHYIDSSTVISSAQAIYDPKTDRLVFKNPSPVCMTLLKAIMFVNVD